MIYDEGDANPMHRRIPGEVVSRRRVAPKKVQPEKEPDEVVVDLKATMTLKPEARVKWLTKACMMVTNGNASSTDLYDVVVNRKFVSGMPERVVRKISVVLQDSLDLFSDKQQRYLSSNECPIMARLVARDADRADDLAAAFEEGRPGEAGGLAGEEPETPRGGKASAQDLPRRPSAPQGASAGSATASAAAAARPPAQRADPADGASTWTSVKDEFSLRRQEAESKEQTKRDAARRAEKDREKRKEEEAAARTAAAAEAERRRKLEEDADALFDFAVAAPPVALMSSSRDAGGDRKRSRSLSRSRSISSRTARRLARANKREKQNKDGRGSWQRESSSAMTGSRAILMNRDFQEDLPHMPRQGGSSRGSRH